MKGRGSRSTQPFRAPADAGSNIILQLIVFTQSFIVGRSLTSAGGRWKQLHTTAHRFHAVLYCRAITNERRRTLKATSYYSSSFSHSPSL